MFGLTTFAQTPFAGLGGNTYAVSLTESVTPTSTQSSQVILSVSVIESAGIFDNITYTVDAKGIVTGVLLTVSLSSPNVWGKVNDDQTPNWTRINDNSNPDWVSIDNVTNPNWVSIKN